MIYNKTETEINGYSVYSVTLDKSVGKVCLGFYELKIVEEEYSYRSFIEDCMGTGLYVYVDSKFYFISTALEIGLITEENVLETNLGIVRDFDTDDNPELNRSAILEKYGHVDDTSMKYIHTINGYNIYQIPISDTCSSIETVQFRYDGGEFKYYECLEEINIWGLVVVKDAEVYNLKSLIEDSEISETNFFYSLLPLIE